MNLHKNEFNSSSLHSHKSVTRVRRRATGDAGVTLIELLIVVVVTPMLIFASAAGLMTMFKTQNTVGSIVNGVSNSRLTSSNLSSDLRSASQVTRQPTPSCGPATINNREVTQILGLQSEDGSSVISYVNQVDGANWALVRVVCEGFDTTTPTSTTVVAVSTTPLSASVTCNTVAVTCDPTSTWIPNVGIADVSLPISPTANLVVSPMTFTPPQTTTTTAPTTTTTVGAGSTTTTTTAPTTTTTVVNTNTTISQAPLILLSTVCPPAVAQFGARSVLSVGNGTGLMAINATCDNAVVFSDSGGYRGRGWKSHGHSRKVVYGPTPLVSAVLDYTGTPDPFSSLTAPLASDVSAPGTVVCVNNVCPSGTYNNTLNFKSGAYSFTGGKYIFNQPVLIGGPRGRGASVTFGNGNFVFNGGLIVSGNAHVSFGSGTAIFNGPTGVCKRPDTEHWNWEHSLDDDDFWNHVNAQSPACSYGPNNERDWDDDSYHRANRPALSVFGHATFTTSGMLLYVASGGMSFQSSGHGGGSVALAGNPSYALAGNPSYGGIALWDPVTAGSGQAIISSHTKEGATNYGGVYIPNQRVVIGQGGVVNMSFLVTDSLQMLGYGTLNVG